MLKLSTAVILQATHCTGLRLSERSAQSTTGDRNLHLIPQAADCETQAQILKQGETQEQRG